MTSFQELRQKYNSFDWEYYGSNYFDDKMKSLNLNKEDCWWHYLTIGKEEKNIFFDIKDKKKREKEAEHFDWEEYQINYDLNKDLFPTRFHLWWHYLNIGEPKGFMYFSKENKYENEKKKFNFDWEFYLKKYPYILDNEKPDDNKVWWHYLNKGKGQGYLYFDNLDTNKNSLQKKYSLESRNLFYKNKNPNILLYVENTINNINHPVNQKIVKSICHILTNQFNEINIYLVKFDFLIQEFVHLGEKELEILQLPIKEKLNYLKGIGYAVKNDYFESIKNKKDNILLFSEELTSFKLEKYETMTNVIFQKKYKTCFLYSGNLIFQKVMEDPFTDTFIVRYFKIISKFHIVFVPSLKAKEMLEQEFKSYKLAKPDFIIFQSLPEEQFGFPRIKKTISDVKNYIFSIVNFNENNNVKMLFQAFTLFLNKNPKYQLYIYSVSFHTDIIYYNQIQQQFLLNKNITILQNKTDLEINNYIKNSLFTIAPRIEDYYGLEIKQSLWNNKICICHNNELNQDLSNSFPGVVRSINCLDEEILIKEMEFCIQEEELNSINQTISTFTFKNWNTYCMELLNVCKTKNIVSYSALSITGIKQTIYFYAEKILSDHRSGIENVSIQLVRKMIQQKTLQIDIIFVKWDVNDKKLVPCSSHEVKHIFNFGEDNMFNDLIINNTENKISNKNSILLSVELPSLDYNIHLSNYLVENQIKSIYIIHDLLPLQFNFKEYSFLTDYFKSYLYNNILQSYKIISVSDFTKNEFISYIEKNNYTFSTPPIISVPLPYQFKEEPRYQKPNKKEINGFKLLLPGSIESRKQQILFMSIFNSFIKNNPDLDVELIVFGKVLPVIEDLFQKELLKSNGKIVYLKFISNKELSNLYKEVDLTCVISLYEGWGMPISESLWCGTPVLTANFGAMSEVASKGGCYKVDTKNEKAIYKALEEIITCPEILDGLKEEMKKADYSDWEYYGNKILDECIKVFE